jgi:hypothetical protein
MRRFVPVRAALAAAASLVILTIAAAGTSSAAETSPSAALVVGQTAPATSATISGTVVTAAGAPLAGATISVTGPASASTTSDATGAFSVSVPPGVYHISVMHTGYSSSSLNDVTVAAGTSQPLAVTLSQIDLSSMRTIGSVTSVRGGSSINTTAASQTVVTAQAFQNSASSQINDVLQRIPDVVIQKLGTQQDTSIVVGGMQPYETQVLIDGHPIALGQYGVWFSQYFPSFMIGSVETQTGPGNTTPFANLAVGGTANIQTPGYTTKTVSTLTYGYDNWQSQNYNALFSGKVGDKLSYVVAGGYTGQNNYFYGKSACDAYYPSPSPTFPGAASPGPNQAGQEAIIAFCGSLGSAFYNKGMVEKLKFDFSDAMSVELGFVGSYGGYNPQDSSWGESLGPATIVDCLPGTNYCTNPGYANLIGKTISTDFWYPGTKIFNSQQIFTAQLRAAIGNTTLLIRPYVGSIQPETYDAGGEWNYPAYFSPNATYPACPDTSYPESTCYSGPQTYPAGTVVPPNPDSNNYFGAPLLGPNGQPTNNNFENNTCGALTSTAAYVVVGPDGQEHTVNGQQQCFQYPYDTFELDTLYGSTISLVHPLGDGFIDFTYDYHGQSTYAYVNSPSNVVVPQGSSTRFSTFSLTGSIAALKNVTIPFGVYNTTWTAAGQILNNNPLLNLCPGGTAGDGTTCGLQRAQSYVDPHIAFVWRPAPNQSYRLAYGTSTTFPFIGDLSGAPAYQPPAGGFSAGLYTYKTPGLLPEHSLAFSIGGDHRLKNGAVMSLDLSTTTVHDVFQQLSGALQLSYGLQGVFIPVNVSSLQTKLATLKYTYAPAIGFGYNLSVAADSSVTNGVPASYMPDIPISLPANGVQVCGTGLFTPGSATCIPYLKGYGQFTFTSKAHTYVALGVDYEGKNNAYYQPPFAIADLTIRQPFAHIFEGLLSVQNLFNTDSFSYLPAPNLGVPVVANYSTDGKTVQQGSYPTYLIPAATRTLRFELKAHLGGY